MSEGRSHMHCKVGWQLTWTPQVHAASLFKIMPAVSGTSLPCCTASTAHISVDQLVLPCMLKPSLWSCHCLFNKRLAQWYVFWQLLSKFDVVFLNILFKGRGEFCISSCESQSICQNSKESPKHICFPFLKPGYLSPLLFLCMLL